MNPLEKRTYPYVQSWKTTILAILFFGSSTVGVAFMASSNTKGMKFLRVIDMAPAAATRFLYACSIAGALLTSAAVFGIWRRLARPQEITLDDTGLTVPRGYLSREVVRVPFSEITNVSVERVTGDRFLKVIARDGIRHTITQSHLPSKAAFEEIHAAVRERAG